MQIFENFVRLLQVFPSLQGAAGDFPPAGLLFVLFFIEYSFL